MEKLYDTKSREENLSRMMGIYEGINRTFYTQEQATFLLADDSFDIELKIIAEIFLQQKIVLSLTVNEVVVP